MTAQEFIAWREHLALNRREAAEALGLSKTTVTTYEHARAHIPRYVALACTALANNLRPWPVG